MEDVKRLGIYLTNLSGATGREQQRIRPCLVVSNPKSALHSDIVIVVPITSKQKASLPTHVALGRETGLFKDSTAEAEQIRTIDKQRIIKYIGSVNDEETSKKIQKALEIAIEP